MNTKHIFTSFILLLSSFILSAQIPQGFSYQAVIGDAGGEPMANQNVTLRFSIWHLDSPESFTAYQETIATTTNAFGLVNHVVGTGTAIIGSYGTVDWNADIPFPWQMRTEVNTGNGFVDLGSQFFQTVPFAEVARSNWALNGNEGTDEDTHFIGTTDNQALVFKVNNNEEMSLSSWGIEVPGSIDVGGGILLDGNTISNYNGLSIFSNNDVMLGNWYGTLKLDEYGNLGLGDAYALAENAPYSPVARLHVGGGTEASLATHGYFVLGQVADHNIVMDYDEIMARNNGNASSLYLNAHGGNVGIGTGSSIPKSNLHVMGGTDAVLATDASGYFIIGDVDGSNIVIDNNEIISRNNGLENELYLNAEGGGVVINSATSTTHELLVNGTAAKPGGGSWTSTSDARLKENVQPFTQGLDEVMEISPVTYHYIEQTGHDTSVEHVGVIAQDLQKISPTMVSENEMEMVDGTKGDYLSVDPSAFTYMLINSIQEQQKQIEVQQKQIEELRKEVENLKSR